MQPFHLTLKCLQSFAGFDMMNDITTTNLDLKRHIWWYYQLVDTGFFKIKFKISSEINWQKEKNIKTKKKCNEVQSTKIIQEEYSIVCDTESLLWSWE